MIKKLLRKIVRVMSAWPFIGRFLQIAVAVIRLPQFRATYLDQRNRQHIFETQQLPTLLQTLSDLNHRQLSINNERDNLVISVPVALRKTTRDMVEMRGQLERVSSSVQYLLGRLEFVRRELMFEMRYGASTPSGEGEKIKAKTEILSPERLAAARNKSVRLNLGCGHVSLEGYLNVDRRALPGVDIVAEVDDVPFGQNEVDEIFSAHLLEHFPQEQLRRELLPYFFNLLKEGGQFHAVVPDSEAMIREYSSGQYSYDEMREVIYGAQDYDGGFHFNMFTPESLTKLLKEAGFENPRIIECGRRNGNCYEFEISAEKQKKK
jgi:predicted SAM-dependent methyltransferase